MTRFSWLVIASAVALALVVSFVSRSAAAPKRTGARTVYPLLRTAYANGSIGSLDQFRQGLAGASSDVTNLALEPLVSLNAQRRVIPWLAQSWRIPNKGTIIFSLRKGVKFWDGRELTADDVANAINYYRFPQSKVAVQYVFIREVRASGRYTVVMTLKKPDPYALTKLATAGSGIFEKRFQQQHGADMGKPGVLTMGTGPWMFQSFDPTSGVEFTANPHYWRGTVPFRHISYKFIANEQTEALAVRAGQVDAVAYVTDPVSFAATAGVKPVTVPDCIVPFFAMNTKQGPWADIHARRAAAYAINKSDIIAAVGPLASTPSQTYIARQLLATSAPPAAVDHLLKSLPQYPFNLAKARAELAQSKTPNGFTVELHVLNYGGFPQATQVIADNLAKIGIKLKLSSIDIGEWANEYYAFPKPDDFYTYLTCVPDPLGTILYGLVSKQAKAGGLNLSQYTNPKLDALVGAAESQYSETKRFALYGQILKILADDLPVIPLYNGSASYWVSSKFTWRGYLPSLYRFVGPWALNIAPK
jgi:peptide/nickel transport system substrate-binding protein